MMEPARTPQQVFTVVEGGSPGMLMRSARERLGLSIDDVCEKLKMMPSQIRAMESDSLDGLPPGGYARAFIKGYARLLGLDADQIVTSMMAVHSGAGAVDGPVPLKVSPAVAAQRQADAEAEDAELKGLRRDSVSVSHNFGQLISEPSSDGKLVKYSLAALVLGLLVYLLVPAVRPDRPEVTTIQTPVEVPAAPPPVMAERIAPGQPGAVQPGNAESAFPPGTVMVPAQPTEPPGAGVQVLSSPPAAAAQVVAPAVPATVSPTTPVVQPGAQTSTIAQAPVTASSKVSQPAAAKDTAAPVAAPPVRSQPAPAVAPAQSSQAVIPSGVSAGSQRIRMVFTDRAYITIRDRDGHVLMAKLNAAGTEQTVEGNPPFKVIIGNARAVQMEYRGRSFDLSPHTKDDVARFVME